MGVIYRLFTQLLTADRLSSASRVECVAPFLSFYLRAKGQFCVHFSSPSFDLALYRSLDVCFPLPHTNTRNNRTEEKAI